MAAVSVLGKSWRQQRVGEVVLDELQTEAARWHPVSVQRLGEGDVEAGVADLTRREADEDTLGCAITELALPRAELAAGLVDDPPPDGTPRAATFGEADESFGAEQTVPRVLPAEQRLDGDDRVLRVDRHDGLVEDAELSELEGAADLALEMALHPDCGTSVPTTHHEPAPAPLLGLVHRAVGVGDQLLLHKRRRAPAGGLHHHPLHGCVCERHGGHGFVDTIRDGHATTPIAIVTPNICPVAEDHPGPTLLGRDERYHVVERAPELSTGALTLRRIRTLLDEIVAARRREGDTNHHLVDGLSLFGADDVGDLHDGLHPNADGYRRIGVRFSEQVSQIAGRSAGSATVPSTEAEP